MEVINFETALRLGVFVTALLLFALLSTAFPRRRLRAIWWQRWLDNLGLTAVDTWLLRLLFPAAAVGFAAYVNEQGWGLMNLWSPPSWLTALISIVALDLLVYWQHVFFHKIPLLWRLHKVHHTDLDVDVTTGFRFHPIEIILSMLIKCAAIAILGASAWGVLLFELILSTSAMFNHSNLRLAPTLDHLLRLIIVTPDMHRVHHSAIPKETDSNFGFALSLWDRWFKSYRPQPQAGHDDMIIGLKEHRELSQLHLPRLLLMPFLPNKR